MQGIVNRTSETTWGQLKKNGFAMLKGHPCRVTNIVGIAQTKHSGPKSEVHGTDIFTGQEFVDGGVNNGSCHTPVVQYKEYELNEVMDGNTLVLMTDSDFRDDFKMPHGSKANEDLAQLIKKGVAAKKTVFVKVLSACGKEKISDARTA